MYTHDLGTINETVKRSKELGNPPSQNIQAEIQLAMAERLEAASDSLADIRAVLSRIADMISMMPSG